MSTASAGAHRASALSPANANAAAHAHAANSASLAAGAGPGSAAYAGRGRASDGGCGDLASAPLGDAMSLKDEQLRTLDRDNFYYKQTNRELKRKLRELVATSEAERTTMETERDAARSKCADGFRTHRDAWCRLLCWPSPCCVVARRCGCSRERATQSCRSLAAGPAAAVPLAPPRLRPALVAYPHRLTHPPFCPSSPARPSTGFTDQPTNHKAIRARTARSLAHR